MCFGEVDMDQAVIVDHASPTSDLWIALYRRGMGFFDVINLLLSFLPGPGMGLEKCFICYIRQCDGLRTDGYDTVHKILCVDV